MRIRTVSLLVSAPRDTVFNFLADIENLPQWATGFCERISLHRGGWWALTTQGELAVLIETNAGAGVIDLHAGPAVDRMTPFPIRVLPLSVRTALISFTLIQPPELTDEGYEQRYRALVAEARGLLRRFGGGTMHGPDARREPVSHGVN